MAVNTNTRSVIPKGTASPTIITATPATTVAVAPATTAKGAFVTTPAAPE